MDASGISSRFASEKSIQEAQERRKEEWQKAYERMGQKPPEQEPEQYDPRTLYEKLQEQKATKQSAFEEKYSIRNQFRALDDDETTFLSSVLDDKRAREAARQAEIDAELAAFRQAVNEKQAVPEGSPPVGAATPLASSAAATTSGSPPPTTQTSSSSSIIGKTAPPKTGKAASKQKGLLAGAIKRKLSAGDKDKKRPAPASLKEGSTPAATVSPVNDKKRSAAVDDTASSVDGSTSAPSLGHTKADQGESESEPAAKKIKSA